MQFQAEREAIIESCLQMCADNLTLGTSGNISIRVGDLVAISPSGVPYPDLTPEMIPIVGSARQPCRRSLQTFIRDPLTHVDLP